MNKITATRYHDFSYGHRVAGHESKCANLHGHNGRATFTVAADLDAVGRVLDFSAIKSTLCEWLEENWDHKFLAWVNDHPMRSIVDAVLSREITGAPHMEPVDIIASSMVWTLFNPTAENMALYLLNIIGPQILPKGVTLIRVEVSETRKCSATAEIK